MPAKVTHAERLEQSRLKASQERKDAQRWRQLISLLAEDANMHEDVIRANLINVLAEYNAHGLINLPWPEDRPPYHIEPLRTTTQQDVQRAVD